MNWHMFNFGTGPRASGHRVLKTSPMPTIKSVQQFDVLWKRARTEASKQGAKVSYDEIKDALEVVTRGKITRAVAAYVADTMANEPFLTGPAAKEAFAFLKIIGADQELDAASKAAVRAEFSLRAIKPYKSLSVPGREVANTVDLPDAVDKAAKQMKQGGDNAWEDVVVKKASLAGQDVFIVHYSALDDGNLDAEKVRVFGKNGKEIASGSLFDPMGGFAWD